MFLRIQLNVNIPYSGHSIPIYAGVGDLSCFLINLKVPNFLDSIRIAGKGPLSQQYCI